jgi:hypothetical protein
MILIKNKRIKFMKKIIISAVLIFTLHILIHSEEKISIGGFGLELDVDENEVGPEDYFFYRIDSKEKADLSLKFIMRHISSQKKILLVEGLVKRWTYEKSVFYIVTSPKTKNIKIDDAYHLKDSNKLIYEISENKDYKGGSYFYFRSIAIDKNEDKFTPFLKTESGEKQITVASLDFNTEQVIDNSSFGHKFTVQSYWKKMMDNYYEDRKMYFIAYNIEKVWSESEKKYIDNNVMIITQGLKNFNKDVKDDLSTLKKNIANGLIEFKEIPAEAGKAFLFKHKYGNTVYIMEIHYLSSKKNLFKVVFTATEGTYDMNKGIFAEFLKKFIML